MKLTLALMSLLAISANSQEDCGPGGQVLIAGSSTVRPLSESWGGGFNGVCPDPVTNFTIEGGGSSAGAGRVCDNTEEGTAVDIGNMSRDWKKSEGELQANGWIYNCLEGDTDRSTAQFSVGFDGVVVVAKKGGDVEACLEKLGGLDLLQLRWMFSSYTAEELLAEEDPGSLAGIDDDEIRMWNELNEECPEVEIKIAGPDSSHGTNDFFKSIVLIDNINGEEFSGNLLEYAENEDILDIIDQEDAIAFFGYETYERNKDILTVVAIENTIGDFVVPSVDTIADGSYDVMVRPIYMNLHIDTDPLEKTLPYIQFGYSESGDELALEDGYVPVGPGIKAEMEVHRMSFLYSEYVWNEEEKNEYWCSGTSENITAAGSSTVLPLMDAWSEAYTKQCPDVTFSIEGGGSSTGAGRVCANEDMGSKVMIGAMSRDWKDSEALNVDGPTFNCEAGDSSIVVTQVPVGFDGLTLVVKKDGAAATCIEAKGGLTASEIRWMFSSYSAEELFVSGLDEDSAPKTQGEDRPRKWSQLDSQCPDAEIKIAGPDSNSGTYDFFMETFLTDNENGETFGPGYYNSTEDDKILSYLQENEDAIGYFGYAYYKENEDELTAAAVENDNSGEFILPSSETIANLTYPVVRGLFLNVNNEYMNEIYPFLRFVFSTYGTDIVDEVGYVPLSKIPVFWRESWMAVEDVVNA